MRNLEREREIEPDRVKFETRRRVREFETEKRRHAATETRVLATGAMPDRGSRG